MPDFAYFVTIETRDKYDTLAAFVEVAGQLSNALQTTLGDHPTLCAITRTDKLSRANVEVEIALSEEDCSWTPEHRSKVIARAVVKASLPEKSTFDKTLFTKRVRDLLPFTVKVTKQSISQEELFATEEAA